MAEHDFTIRAKENGSPVVAVLYAIRHRTCGHVGGIFPDRAMAVATIDTLDLTGNHSWRVRAGATDEDIAAALRGDSCETCTFRKEGDG